MDRYLEKLGYKKGAFILGIIAFLLLILLLLPILFSKKNQSVNEENHAASPTSYQLSTMQSYQSDTYSLQYPQGWTISTFPTSTTFQYKQKDNTYVFLSVSVFKDPSIAQYYIASYQSQKLLQSKATLNGNAANRYTGMMQSQGEGESENSSSHITAYIVKKNGVTYIIVSGYERDRDNPVLDQQLESIAQTIVIY